MSLLKGEQCDILTLEYSSGRENLKNCLKSPAPQNYQPLYIELTHLLIISVVNQPDAQYLKFILFWNNTLHVSDGFSVHHQESKTVHTASGARHTGSVAQIYFILE